MEQGITSGEVNAEIRSLGEFRKAGELQGGEQEAEPGDGDGKRVEIDPGDRIESMLGHDPGIHLWMVLLPEGGEAVEGAQAKVTGAAGGIDEAHCAIAERLDGWGEGAVEDEFLNESGRLEQGVAFAGGLGEVLVQVSKKAGVPGRVGQVVGQVAGGRIDGAPEIDKGRGGVTGNRLGPERRVPLVEKVRQPGQAGELSEDVEQVVAVRMRGMFAEVRLAHIASDRPARAGAGQARGGDEVVVFQETEENGREDPRDRPLRQLIAEPGVKGGCGALLVPGRLPEGAHPISEFRHLPALLAQVRFKQGDAPLQVGQESGSGRHGKRVKAEMAESRR